MKLFATGIFALCALCSAHPEFKAATSFVSKSDPAVYNPSDDTQLECYGLYKQAVSGNCNKAEPIVHPLISKLKYDAWCKNFGLSKPEAEDKYVAFLSREVPDWRARQL